MKRTLLIATLIVAACASAPAQENSRASVKGRSQTSARAGDALQIDQGTRLAAQLQQTLDVRKARVGDEVVLKTTDAIKSNGRTVVEKGARLVGRVTEVKPRAQGSSSSSIGLVFDRLESGALSTPISATITSITEVRARASDDDSGTSTDARSSSSASASASGGGLLGGVSNTVGGVVDTTTNAAGSAVGATTGAVGSAGRAISGLRITESTNADVQGGSTLSLLGGNLRLEKNATFHLVLNESAGVN